MGSFARRAKKYSSEIGGKKYEVRALLSFVMVRLSFDDGAGSIDLLGKGEADHLV